MSKAIGLYIHVPFCLQKCGYCDFYSGGYTDALADSYTARLIRAVRTQPFGEVRVETIYFGGGTPSLLGSRRLREIYSAVRATFEVSESAEITLEVNPKTVTADSLKELREIGFNRLSVGVQSLSDGELRALGRIHDSAEAVQTITEGEKAGFENISADVMLGIPGQSLGTLTESIKRLSEQGVSHISAYLLKIEENTAFWRDRARLSLPDDDFAAELYLSCVSQLNSSGFKQYEISNFAREEKFSRHNMIYWKLGEYLGIGPAAHSFMEGKRFYFPRSTEEFIAAENAYEMTVPDGAGGGFEEKIMLGLRLTEGILLSEIPGKIAAKFTAEAKLLETYGMLALTDTAVSLTTKGFLLSNTVIGRLLGAANGE